MKGRTGKLGLTGSALSRHIAKLEGDLGVSLFERHARGMFYRTLTIACTEGFAFDFLPVSLAAFCAKHSDVAIRLEAVQSDRASPMLLSGEASIALAFSFEPEAGVVVQFTQRAPVMALMHLEHPSRSDRRLHWKNSVRTPSCCRTRGRRTGNSSTSRAMSIALRFRR